MMGDETGQIGEAVSAWADLGPTRPSPSFAPRQQPSAKVVEIMGKLGLRYPPANSVDRDAHAARVALLAEDCADIEPEWLDQAAREWARREHFMPRACELREQALAIGRISRPDRLLAPPPRAERPKPPPAPPLTDDEIRKLPRALIDMGVKLGEISAERAERLRGNG